MFLIFNALVASLDGLIIGIGLRLANIKISKKNILIILLGNLFVYYFSLYIYKSFNLSFMSKTFTTILYLVLAYQAFKNKDEVNFNGKNLNLLNCLILTLTHSLDGAIISLNFVYSYNIMYISLIFSIMSLLTLLIGYYFAKYLKNLSKNNYISALLFIILAVINQYF